MASDSPAPDWRVARSLSFFLSFSQLVASPLLVALNPLLAAVHDDED